jgi:hypothetical protein
MRKNPGANAAPPPPATPLVEPMKPWRVWLVYGVVGVIVLGHLYEIVRQEEHWPFSNYEMWARPSKEWHIRNVVPVGLTAEALSEEVELTDPAYFEPLPPHYQKIAISRVARREAQRETMLRDYLDYYETRRQAGMHFGPPLRGVRLYEYHWKLEPDAHNAGPPDSRTLLYEYVPGTTPHTAPTTAGAVR